ncbi:hypothetical protein [Nocardioides sp. GCM10030258]|uniref:hypothetical protein n=1 Tax=unclassified Nocardioides TaxID=2615069 RepID=UPI00360D6AD2
MNEPVEVVDEKPLLLRQALKQAFGGQTVALVSHIVGFDPAWILRWTQVVDAEPPPRPTIVIDIL